MASQVMKRAVIRTISFHVFFDDSNIAYQSAIEASTNIVKVTLTGNEDQLSGFICFFFARYGCSGLQSHELQEKEILKYHKDHFHDDAYRIDVANGTRQRYLISFGHGSHEWDTMTFATPEIEDFVSGMEAVPSKIDLINPDHSITTINCFYSGAGWKEEYRYLDLKDPETHRKFFINERYSEREIFEQGSILGSVNTKTITPVEVSISRSLDYVIPVSPLSGSYLASLSRKEYRDIPVHTLEAAYSVDDGYAIHSIGIAQICKRLKVAKLVWSHSEDLGERYLDTLAECATREYPFLSELKEIEILYYSTLPMFWDLMTNSNVHTLTFRLPEGRMASGWTAPPKGPSYRIIEALSDHKIAKNHHLREVYFILPNSEKRATYQTLVARNLSYQELYVVDTLDRNRRAFQQCKSVVIALLGLKTRKHLPFDRHLFPLMAKEIWKTRGTAIWSK